MNIVLQNIFIAFLILLTVGSVLFCTITPTLSMNSMSHEMPLSQSGFMSHLSYVKELTSATTDIHFSVSFVVLFLAFVSFIFFTSLCLPLENKAPEYVKRQHRDKSYSINPEINHWLSLFELSPNFIKPT